MQAPRKRGWNYPRRGLGPIHRWLPSWRFVLAALSAVFALGIAAFATLYATTKVPDPSEFALAQATTVYYSDGKTPLGTFADYDRKPVDLDTLPDYVAHAVVASEDQSFYTNNGISLPSIARAFMNNIRGGSRQGGSTLTQQYVERYFLGTTTSFTGKIHEA
ncbi:MAG: transglycosylase domain-containing protein, partial [Ancrocorticia sp.]|nr:transglycosylase domain-containing protein [Ancrocorticia sp.]